MEQTEEQMQEKTIAFNEEIKDHLKVSAKWGNFLAIVGYIGIGFMFLISIGVTAMGTVISRLDTTGTFEKFKFVLIIYFLIAIIYLFPTTYLYRFSNKILNGIKYNNQNLVDGGFKNLKLFFQFTGILLIVVLSIYVLIIIFAIAFSSMLAMA